MLILLLLIFLLPPLLALFWVVYSWRKVGRDADTNKTIIPQYEAPAGINAITADILMNQKLTSRALAAALADLAVKGYVQFNETTRQSGNSHPGVIELELIKQPADLAKEYRLVIEVFFGNTPEVGDRVKETDIARNFITEGAVNYLALYAGEKATTDGYFTEVPRKASVPVYRLALMALMISLVLLVLAVISLVISLSEILPKSSEVYFQTFCWVSVSAGLGLLVAYKVLKQSRSIMPARTAKGVEALGHLFGVHEYIKLAEADRLKYLQSTTGAERVASNQPAESLERKKLHIYEELLPYAILFGLEKSWAKEYQGLQKDALKNITGIFDLAWYGDFIGTLPLFSVSMKSNDKN